MLKSDLDKNTSINEEASFMTDAVLSQNIWIDSKYIPEDISTVTFQDNIYSVFENQTELNIIQKCEKMELLKVKGTRASYVTVSPSLKGFIPESYGKNYKVTITDANDEIIPFGYNDWIVDSGNGLLTFNRGEPKEFQAPYYISCYKYIGRTGNNIITTSGGDLDEEYIPVHDSSIATKGYIDTLYKNINEAVGNLIPDKPATLEGQKLEVSAPHYFKAKYVKSNVEYNCILEGDAITITTDYFYNEGVGSAKVYIGEEDIDISFPMSKSVPIGPYNSYVEILDNKDAYENLMTGFYTVLKVKITIPYSKYQPYFTESSPFISIRIGYNDYFSDYVTLGIERLPDSPAVTFPVLILDEATHTYASGVPSLEANTVIKFEALSSNLTRFYNEKFIKLLVGGFYEKDILPNVACYDQTPVYNGGEVTYNIGEKIQIPADIYMEDIDCTVIAYDVFGNEVNSVTNSFHVRIDTFTKNPRRTSGIGQIPDDTALAIFKNKNSLIETNELQQRAKDIIYPQDDYSQNGIRQYLGETGETPYFHEYIIDNSVQGPDYSSLKSNPSMRYITYKYVLPEYVNAFIVHIETENISHNKNTFVMDQCSLQCKVEDTGWLDCNSPYDGVSIPEKNNDPSLVVYRSSETEKYITFGSNPRTGPLYLRFGMSNVNGIVKSIDIEPILLNS